MKRLGSSTPHSTPCSGAKISESGSDCRFKGRPVCCVRLSRCTGHQNPWHSKNFIR